MVVLMRGGSWKVAAAVAVAGVSWAVPREAAACGGCFHADPAVLSSPEASVVTGHRMAVSVSPAQTVLWDQVSYDGDPQDFAWVLPVGPGARLEVATDAFFEALEAVTQATVGAPPLTCDRGFEGDTGGAVGCGGTAAGPQADSVAGGSSGGGGGDNGPIQVLSEATVGPYATLLVRSEQPGALARWLRGHDYLIPTDVDPILADYEADGADFIALRLAPGQGVRSMKPVRVVYPGPLLTFPLRMVNAGTGERVGVVLYVIGEGRWGVVSGENVELDTSRLVFDMAAGRSNRSELVAEALAANRGNAWLTAFARRGALLEPIPNVITGGDSIFMAANSRGSTDNTLAGLYISQALANGESDDATCRAAWNALATEQRAIVNPCDSTGYCRALAEDELDVRTLSCGAADDLAVALVGSHPASTWLTRLEAQLPRSALQVDLGLGAHPRQRTVEHLVVAPEAANAPCPVQTEPVAAQAALAPARNLGNLVTAWGPLVLGLVWVRRRARRVR